MGHLSKAIVILLLIGLGACADRETIVLLEDDGGHAGAVTVTKVESGDEITIDKALQTATVAGDGQLRAGTMTDQDVRERFGDALDMLPEGSKSFTLYFVLGTTVLTDESEPELPKIFAEIDRRPAPEVVVIGHTDRAGDEGYNDGLSLRRAAAVAEWLIGKGVGAEIVTTAGRGEREPMVATEDGVFEARNRRVEILVR
jgi:outer membrane protein OmpA-like peptidoglycan-associated protein